VPRHKTISYEPNPSSVPFHHSKAEVKALCGPVGSGKSSAACWEIFFLARESPVATRSLILRESYPQLRDSTLKTWMEWFEPISVHNKAENTITFTLQGPQGQDLHHELHLRHARRVEDATQFLSTEYALIWLEEVVPAFDTVKGIVGGGIPKGIYDVVSTRLRQKDVHRRHILLTFNPPNKYHWTYSEFFKPSEEQLREKNSVLFRQPAYENRPNLPQNYYKTLEARLGPDLARRFVLGEVWTSYPGVRVFPEFFEEHHLKDNLEYEKGKPLVLAFDFGLTPVCLIAQVKEAGRLEIYRELQMWNTGISKLADQLQIVLADEFPGCTEWRAWGDPAGTARSQTDEKTCFQVLASKGFPCQPGAIDLQTRKEAVKQRLQKFINGKQALLIDQERCPMLSEALLGGYRYPQSADGRIGERPMKNKFSHCCDALQYLCTGEYTILEDQRRLLEARSKIPRYDPFSIASHGSGGWMSQ